MAVKKTIRFKDLDDRDVEQDWYFSLDKADVVEMDLLHEHGGEGADVVAYLSSILKEKKTRELLALWKELLFLSVGRREGNLLIKDQQAVRDFRFGGAYRQFFSEIMEMEDAGAAFFMSIMPADVQEEVAKQNSRVYTKDEMLAMTNDEFNKAFGTDETSYTPEQLLVAFQRRNNKAA